MAGESSKGSEFFFIANLLNFVLATALFTLPFPMYKTGHVLSTIILAVTCFASVVACTFIIEALGRKNALVRQERKILQEALRDGGGEKKEETKEETKEAVNNEVVKDTDQSNSQTDDENMTSPLKLADLGGSIEESDDEFYIGKRFEISKLAKLLSKPLYFFVSITIICYLYVGVTSNGIIAGNNLKDIIGKTIGKKLPDFWYYIIVFLFDIIVVLLALNNIKHLKKFSLFIMIMRFVMIALIIGCCIYTIAKYGSTNFSKDTKLKAFSFENITVLIGNGLFVFMSHHSIPGMVENFYPQKNLMKLLLIGYICSLCFLVFYGYIAILAFGSEDLPCEYEDEFPAAIQSTFSSNFLKVKVVGYIINYYPILNVITSGMQLISLRNNLLDLIGGCRADWQKKLNFAEMEGGMNVLKNFAFNFVIAIPPIGLGLGLKNVQTLMKYFSATLGYLLKLIVPILVITGYRFLWERKNFKTGNLNQSFLKGKPAIYIMCPLAVIYAGLIIYGFVASPPPKTCILD